MSILAVCFGKYEKADNELPILSMLRCHTQRRLQLLSRIFLSIQVMIASTQTLWFFVESQRHGTTLQRTVI